MTGLPRLGVGLGVAVAALAPWPLVLGYAWANNTDWGAVISVLVPIAVVVLVWLGFFLGVKELRPILRGWPIIPISWLLAIGGLFWIGFRTQGF